jgi:hypothetical protein
MTDARAALDQVRVMIRSGRYRDEIPGLPGVALSGGGMFRGDRRLYWRGTSEYATAEVEGLLDRLPPPPAPASPAAIEEAETLLGGPLPGLLKELFMEANGGFGPGYGMLGLRGGFTDDTGRTALDICTEISRGMWPGAPPGLLPLCHWGCAIYSFVQCPSGQIYAWDPNPVEPDDDIPFFAQDYDFDSWIESWLDGSLQQPWLMYDPETHRYRGATIEETQAALDAEH